MGFIQSIECSYGSKIHFYESLRMWQATQPPMQAAEQQPMQPPEQQQMKQRSDDVGDAISSLENILKNASMDDTIISHFKENNALLPPMRRKLMQTIAEYYVERGRTSLSSDMLKSMARQIVTKFHGEVEVSVDAVCIYFCCHKFPPPKYSYFFLVNSFRKIM